MIVYVDVLIAVNIVINYYLILITAKFSAFNYKNFRLILAAIVGSAFSLYIFLPKLGTLIDIIVKLICSAVMILVGFGFKNLKSYLRNMTVLFAASFIYAGGMLAIWMIFKTKAIVINNSVVYLDVSPIFLIGFSVAFYIIIVFFKSILKRNSITAKRCNVEIYFNKKKADFTGIFDTGNSARDILGGGAVIFISRKNAIDFLGGEPKTFESCYRLLPFSTVTGSKLLEAVRCEKAVITFDNKIITLPKPILAISEAVIDSEYSVLLNPEILQYTEERNVKVKS